MKSEFSTLAGWAAVLMFLMMAMTQALTALVMSLPIMWLVNHVFAPNAIHAVFASSQMGYWRCVGIFGIWFAATARINWTLKS